MMGYALFNGLGSVCYKLGLQKVDMKKVDFLHWNKENVKGFFQIISTPIWIVGAVLVGIDFVIYQYALKSYEVSVVKPLVNLSLIFVLGFGLKILQEKISGLEYLGLGFIITGAILITLYSKEEETIIDYGALKPYLIVMAVLIGILMISMFKIKHFEFFVSVTCGLLFGVGGLFNKAFYASNLAPNYQTLFIVLFIFSYVAAFFYGQAGYLRGRMSIISPIVNIVSIITPFIGGIIIFHENLLIPGKTGIESGVKIIGMISIISGLILHYFGGREGSLKDDIPSSTDVKVSQPEKNKGVESSREGGKK